MNTLTVRPELANPLRRRVLMILGSPGRDGFTNSRLAMLLGESRDVVGRHTRALADADLLAGGRRTEFGVQWSLTETGREQRTLLLAQPAGTE